MKWPPVPSGGRLSFEEGAPATRTLVLMTLGDLNTNPFNSGDISLGEITFKSTQVARGRIENALGRLSAFISVDAVTKMGDPEESEDGKQQYLVEYVDRETRTPSEVRI
jgi:hypothetical protein